METDDRYAHALERIKNSAIVQIIVTPETLKQPLVAIQLGYGVLMDKPIILLVQEGLALPKNLVRASTKIEYAELGDVDSMDRAVRSLCDYANEHLLPAGAP